MQPAPVHPGDPPAAHLARRAGEVLTARVAVMVGGAGGVQLRRSVAGMAQGPAGCDARGSRRLGLGLGNGCGHFVLFESCEYTMLWAEY